MKDIQLEINAIKSKSQKSVYELKGLSNFFKIFAQTYQEEVKQFEDRMEKHESQFTFIDESILSANLLGIYDNFKACNKNTQNLMSKITNELISPLEVFRNTQFDIYQNNINELRNVNKKYEENKDLLEITKQNYYKACDAIKINDNREKSSFFSEGNNSLDISIRKKMKAKNYESIYKYELEIYIIIYIVKSN